MLWEKSEVRSRLTARSFKTVIQSGKMIIVMMSEELITLLTENSCQIEAGS